MFHDNDKDDFFDAPAQPKQPKVKKTPDPTPDDPRFYDKEDNWEHIRPRMKSWKMWMMIAACGLSIGIIYALYIRFFTPYADQQVQYGYVENIERRGEIFKTFEGVFLPYKSLADTIEPYSGDIKFSTNSDPVAADLRRLHLANLPARIEYCTYRSALPWRGEQRIIITAVDTADVTKIYPPAQNHPLIPGPEN